MTGYIRSSSPSLDSTSASATHFEVQRNNFYKPESPYYFKTQIFTDNNQTITGVVFGVTDESVPSKKLLGITKEENQRLLTLIEDNELVNSKIYFKEVLEENDNPFLSIEGVPYRTYILNIVAENMSGELKLYNPLENIIVYSLDGFIYASNEYSNYIPFMVFLDRIILDITPYKNV